MHKDDINELKYQLESVEKSSAPESMKGDDRHHYVIGRGSSKVEGKKTGTIKEATEHTKGNGRNPEFTQK